MPLKSELLAGLKFEDPIALLQTPGADWDYCGAQELVEELTPIIKQTVENPSDKQERPILLVLSSPGQGKSRFLQELPMLINKTEQVDPADRQLFPFLLTLENGMSFDGQFDTDPDKIVVARMLWQLLRNRRASGWAGLKPNFTFSQLHRAVAETANLIVDDILDAMCEGEQLSAANYSILVALDGMQFLPGFDSPTDKTSLFYKTIRKLCQLTTRDDGPLTIAAMAATVQLGVEFALADSPQKRHYVMLPLVDKVCRNGKAVFNFTGNEVLQLLQSDMGGHGRALEALEDACNDQTLENIDLLKDAVIRNLMDRYPKAVPADFEPILKAALSGQWLKPEAKIGNFDPEKLQLVRLEYNSDRSQRRIRLPYIWILLGVTRKDALPDLAKWSLDGYNEICRGPDAGGLAFEDFCARFRVLKSLCWPPDATVRLSDLHHGAILQPKALRNVKVVNRHLKNAQAKQRMATNCRDFLFGKPRREQPAQKRRVQATLADGKMVDLQDTNDQCSYVFLNAEGAPAADCAVLLQLDGQQGFLTECGQCKQGTAKVDLQNIQDERAKSCDENDFLLIICTDGKQIDQSDLPHMTGIVQQEQWQQYFGPYAGRAFQAFRSSQRQ